MKVKTTYIAIDGSEFSDLCECAKHETSLKEKALPLLNLISTISVKQIISPITKTIGLEDCNYICQIYKVENIDDSKNLLYYMNSRLADTDLDLLESDLKNPQDTLYLFSENGDLLFYVGTVKDYIQSICNKFLGND